jgi:Heparinase II/III-like protein/Heparinase II/III N-terminus
VRRLQTRVRWYGMRLQAMSAAELGYRCRQAWEQTRLRFFLAEPSRIVGTQTSLPLIPGFSNGLAALRPHRELIDSWRAVAQSVATGDYQLLGQHWPQTRGPDLWHLDPIAGRVWPARAFCFAVGFREGLGAGDPKYVWELNRLQQLQAVAALSALEQPQRLCELCIQQLESWIAANQPFRGINWSSGIELALRIVSISVMTSSIEQNRLPEPLRRKLVYTLALHGIWLERFLSLFSSANNHLIAEAAGLFLLGILQPDLPRAGIWLHTGRRILERETLLQIHPDGVGAEQSLTYTAFTLEWLLICAVIAESKQMPFPKPILERLRACASFLRSMIDSGGNCPRIGDEDEGSVLHFDGTGEAYVRTIVGYAAGALGCPELAPGTRVQLGNAIFPYVTSGKPHAPGIRLFPTGGYTVARLQDEGEQVFLVLDHGPVGYLSLASHGHADALSVWLHLGGRPVLVDAGTFAYSRGASWRHHFRGTPAHNTLAINGESSSTPAGSFMWSQKASAWLAGYRTGAKMIVKAEHDGFRRRYQVIHRRLISITDQRILIRDRLIGGTQPLPVEINWLVHPCLEVELRDGVFSVMSERAPLLDLRGVASLHAQLYRGSKHPQRGWYSGRYGERLESYQCSFRGALNDREPFTCILDLFGSGAPLGR